jgi:tRNA pseudouridine13 synthase
VEVPAPLPVPHQESRIGITHYATTTPGTGGRLRETPEDFLVEEIVTRGELPAGMGTATILKVRTRDWDTLRLASRIARDLGISRHRVRYAGTKDKHAVCVRHFSVDVPLERARGIGIADVEVLDAWSGLPLALGGLEGNRFTIAISAPRDAPELALALARATLDQITSAGGFPNYFGPQRFGGSRATTHLVGRHLALGDLEGAVKTYIAHEPSGSEVDDRKDGGQIGGGEGTRPPTVAAREAFARGEDPKTVIGQFPARATYERALLQSLIDAPGDHARALRTLPKGLVWMFVHALQSHLFNIALSRRLEAGIGINDPQVGDLLLVRTAAGFEERCVPVEPTNLARCRDQVRAGRAFVSGALPGPECAPASGPQGDIEAAVLDEQGLSPELFTIPELLEASSKGSRRPLLCTLREVSVSAFPRGIVLAFELPSGSYATALTREVIKPIDDEYLSTV